MLQSLIEYYRVLQGVTECYRVLQSITECYKVSQSISSASTWTNFWACFFSRDKFDRIGQSAAFTALFNKLVHYFTLLVLSRVGTCWLLGGGEKETATSKLIIECPAIRIYQTLVCRGGTKYFFF